MDREPAPADFEEEELKIISDLLWRPHSQNYIDFTNPAHVLNVYLLRADLEDARVEDPQCIYGAAGRILNTLEFYEKRAELSSL